MAGASLYLNGKVYSISRDAYSIQVGTRIYSIRKEALSSEQRSKFDQAGSGVLSLILPMEAIESSKSAPTDVASAPRRAN